jgi:hypothetical protein
VETSIESVGRYFAQEEQDPARRARAVHDYVSTRLEYDKLATDAEANHVFSNRRAKCGGYANLFAAIARAAGLRVAVVLGASHAWNAVYMDGEWHSIDTTWDRRGDGTVSHEYFMPSEAVFVRDHVALDMVEERAASHESPTATMRLRRVEETPPFELEIDVADVGRCGHRQAQACFAIGQSYEQDAHDLAAAANWYGKSCDLGLAKGCARKAALERSARPSVPCRPELGIGACVARNMRARS